MAETQNSNYAEYFLETQALHAGACANTTTGALLTPIYQQRILPLV